MQILNITEKEAGQRLDKYLLKYLNQAPKSFIYKMLRKKNIVLNGKKADGSEKLQVEDSLNLFLSEDTILKFSKEEKVEKEIPLDIVYEDNNVIFLNKPAGMLSQKAEPTDVSINEYLISYLVGSNSITKDDLKTFHPAVCNRLDRNTSGLLLAGKTMAGLQELSQMLKERTLKKYYLCLVIGVVKENQLIKGYLHKDQKSNKVKIYATQKGDADYIETAYEPLCNNGIYTLLKVELITGRTHQIRSHMASIGHAIVGDGKYGKSSVNSNFREKYGLQHQLLHAHTVSFGYMDGALKNLENKTFKATLPQLFTTVLKEEHLRE